MSRAEHTSAIGGLPAVRRLIRWTVVTPAYLAAFSIAAVVAVMAYEVFCRYVLGAPTDWALEISTYLLAALVCLGGGYTLREQAHVGMELVYAKMPLRGRRLAQRVSMVCVFVFAVILLWDGVKEVRTAILFNERSLTPLAMPLAYPLALMPIGAFLLALQAVELFFYPPTEPHVAAVEQAEPDHALDTL